MELSEVARLSKEDLLKLLEIALKNTQNIDGHWYLGVEDLLGIEKATELDVQIWAKVAAAEVARLKRSFDFGEGLSALAQALIVSPAWLSFTFGGHEVIRESERALIFRVTNCVSQSARVRAGRGVFDCREVARAMFLHYVAGFAPGAQLECLAAPPRNWSPERWCEWRFVIDGGTLR